VLVLLATLSLAGEASLPAEARAGEVRPSPEESGGLSFLGTFSARAVTTDVVTTNPLVNGQVIGELGGTNSTTTGTEAGAYTEERVGAFFTYAPRLLDGRAALDAAFEVDFAFGDSSYGTGGNTGGAIGADSVNLQTRRLAGRFELLSKQTLVVGLQFVGDGVNDPSRSRLDDLVRSGGRLVFWGTEAAGVALYGKIGSPAAETLRYRVGGFTLYEQAFAAGDDVSLAVADLQLAPAHATRVGLHGWFLRDRAGGSAGLLGSGPASALSEMQGGPRLDFRASEDEVAPEVDVDVAWIGADLGYNAALDAGPVGVHGVVVGNVGKIYVADHGDIGVSGALVDVEGRWRFAPGEGSVARLEALYATGDEDGDSTYTGVLTANSWGIVGAVHATHGSYLLFPDPGAINRAISVVPDVSGKGAGLVAVSSSVGFDAVPNRLGVTVGVAHARDAAANALGTEFNGRVSGRPLPLLNVSAIGAGVGGTALPEAPWTMMLTLDWLVFG